MKTFAILVILSSLMINLSFSRKDCPPGTIDSISSAQRYLGCTHITGSLVISIRDQCGSKYLHRNSLTLIHIDLRKKFKISFRQRCTRIGKLLIRY